MRGTHEDDERPANAGHTVLPGRPRTASTHVIALFREGRLTARADVPDVVARLEDLIGDLEADDNAEPLLQALHARAVLLHRSGAATESCLEAAEDLRTAAVTRREPAWTALGHAQRGLVLVEAGQAGAALADISEADRHAPSGLLPDEPGPEEADAPGLASFLLLDTLARAYARLRLSERSALLRERAADMPDASRLDDLAEFHAAWAADLAVQALEPLAMGTGDPDASLLARAEQVGSALASIPEDVAGERLRRACDAVRALVCAYRGRPTQALRLLGRNAFGEARDLPPLPRQIATLAAMKAHVLVGSIASARTLDEAASTTPAPTVHVVLDICRARERAWLEGHAGGDVLPVMHRLTSLLVQLSWQGLDLVSDTARQALEQHATHEESRTDALTGVGNRRALDEELRHLLRFGPLPLGLVLIDVDHFKKVNDVFTHIVGDEVLREVAGALSDQLRAGDRLLRFGGDEFVALLPETGDQEARRVGNRMADAVASLDWGRIQPGLRVTVTTGCAALWSLTGRRPDTDAERLFRRADEALLDAKRRRTAPIVVPPSPHAHEAHTDWTLTPSHGTTPVPAEEPPARRRPVAEPVPPTAPVAEPAVRVSPPTPPVSTPEPSTPATGLRRRQRHALDEQPITSYVAGRRPSSPAPTEPAPRTESSRRAERAAYPAPQVIDLTDGARRRDRLRPRPPRDAASAFEDPVPDGGDD